MSIPRGGLTRKFSESVAMMPAAPSAFSSVCGRILQDGSGVNDTLELVQADDVLANGAHLMAQKNSIIAVNERLARQINQDARTNPHSKYAGKFVGIANGQVVAVADSLDGVAQQLRLFEPDAAKTFCIEAGVDYDAVEEVWRA